MNHLTHFLGTVLFIISSGHYVCELTRGLIVENICFWLLQYFSNQLKKIVKRYTKVGYSLDVMRQSACLVLNQITVYSYGFLLNFTTVGQASDSMTALT